MQDNNRVEIIINEIKNNCFVIMPFDGLFKSQYEKVIKPAIETTGLKAVRGDEVFSKPHVMVDLWKSIRESRVVLAELTGKNPNVLYELGLAHAIGKPSIIITRNENDVPFDLKSLRYLFYDPNDPFWGDNLKLSISDMIKKVLNEKDFGSGLEDIELISAIPKKPDKEYISTDVVPSFDISGSWKLSWSHMTSNKEFELKSEGVLNLKQNLKQLTGELTVTIPFGGDFMVVHEMLIGSIERKNINLQGVSYTYIKRGEVLVKDNLIYELDTFLLKHINKNKLRGHIIPTRDGVKTELIIEKI